MNLLETIKSGNSCRPPRYIASISIVTETCLIAASVTVRIPFDPPRYKIDWLLGQTAELAKEIAKEIAMQGARPFA
jgi:hypothetical protein